MECAEVEMVRQDVADTMQRCILTMCHSVLAVLPCLTQACISKTVLVKEWCICICCSLYFLGKPGKTGLLNRYLSFLIWKIEQNNRACHIELNIENASIVVPAYSICHVYACFIILTYCVKWGVIENLRSA